MSETKTETTEKKEEGKKKERHGVGLHPRVEGLDENEVASHIRKARNAHNKDDAVE